MHLPVSTAHRLRDMAYTIQNIATDAVPYLMNLNRSYFEQFLYVISSPWIKSIYPRKLQLTDNDNFAVQSDADENQYVDFTEEQSDLCMAGLMGTLHKNSERCFISDKCRAFMVSEKASGYYLTHQLLFYSLGKKLGCEVVMRNRLAVGGFDIKEMERTLCGRVYRQMEVLYSTGEISVVDLFLESAAVCAPLGFYQVMKLDWIAFALKWQDDCGCYKDDHDTPQEQELVSFVIMCSTLITIIL